MRHGGNNHRRENAISTTINSVRQGDSIDYQQIEALHEHQRELEQQLADLADVLREIDENYVDEEDYVEETDKTEHDTEDPNEEHREQ